MKKNIELSIIIVNFNTYRFIDKCLKSIYQSNFPRSQLEIIVIDNDSKDDSVSLLKKNFPNIKLIQNKKNVGFAKANNHGIRQANGNYVLLLNPDTLVDTDTLIEVVSFMDKNASVGIITCRVELPNGTLDDASHRGFPTPWNAFCHFLGLAKLFPNNIFFNGYHLGFKDLNQVHEIDSCAGAFMLIRKKTGEDVSWLDEDYFWYGEDIDFCYRVKKAGWKIIYVPKVKILHYKGVSGGIKDHSREISTADRKTQILAARSRYEVMRIFYEKHYRGIYPSIITSLVMVGIRLKEFLNLLRYH